MTTLFLISSNRKRSLYTKYNFFSTEKIFCYDTTLKFVSPKKEKKMSERDLFLENAFLTLPYELKDIIISYIQPEQKVSFFYKSHKQSLWSHMEHVKRKMYRIIYGNRNGMVLAKLMIDVLPSQTYHMSQYFLRRGYNYIDPDYIYNWNDCYTDYSMFIMDMVEEIEEMEYSIRGLQKENTTTWEINVFNTPIGNHQTNLIALSHIYHILGLWE